MPDTSGIERFEQETLPHLEAAYTFGRWLKRNHQGAQDVTQEACLRAFRWFDGYQNWKHRASLLIIVRNRCHMRLHKNQRADLTELFGGEIHSPEISGNLDPEIPVLDSAGRQTLNRAPKDLPDPSREVLVLRELQGMSYKAIADVTSCSMGAVMLRSTRVRTELRKALCVELSRGY